MIADSASFINRVIRWLIEIHWHFIDSALKSYGSLLQSEDLQYGEKHVSYRHLYAPP
jgi:hypothetical protein